MITVFPIGGIGQRFKEAGYRDPKPFIKLGDQRLIDHVLRSYPIETIKNRRMFIVRREYESEFPFGVFTIDGYTKGPVQTILSQKEASTLLANSKEDVLVADCDSIISPKELDQILDQFRKENVAGGVTTRISRNPAYSYADIDKKGLVKETREKDPFTDNWTTGPYWFKTGRIFHYYASEALKSGILSICPVYNLMIEHGLKVRALPTKTFQHLGSPRELLSYAEHMHITLQQ